jgi:hypothetical protein
VPGRGASVVPSPFRSTSTEEGRERRLALAGEEESHRQPCCADAFANVFEACWTTIRGVEAMDNSYRLPDLMV